MFEPFLGVNLPTPGDTPADRDPFVSKASCCGTVRERLTLS